MDCDELGLLAPDTLDVELTASNHTLPIRLALKLLWALDDDAVGERNLAEASTCLTGVACRGLFSSTVLRRFAKDAVGAKKCSNDVTFFTDIGEGVRLSIEASSFRNELFNRLR